MRLPWQQKGGQAASNEDAQRRGSQAGAEGQPPAEGQPAPAEGQPAPAEGQPPAQPGPRQGSPGKRQGSPGKRGSIAQAPAQQATPPPGQPAPGQAPPGKRGSVAQPAPPAQQAPPPAQPAPAQAPPPAAKPGTKQQVTRQPPGGAAAPAPEPEPVTMEAKVSSRGETPIPSGARKCGKWTLDQLRSTDGLCILQNGTNKFESQKGWLNGGFGTVRNTAFKYKQDVLPEIPEEVLLKTHAEVRLQSGTNKFDSQKGMVGFGTARDVVREHNKVYKNPADLQDLPEEKILLCEGIVRLQSGTNKFASQKGMTGFGTNRRETTKMVDSKHPEYSHETSIDQSTVRLQMGTNKFDSQKGMTGFGTNRRELTKMLDSKHPDAPCDRPDPDGMGEVRYQMGSNQYASKKGMTEFGHFRWEVLQVPGLNRQVQIGQGLIPYQMGSNLYASQKLMVAFGTGRDVVRESAWVEGDPLPFEEVQKSHTFIRYQAGWNKGDSQKGYTSFGSPRDVKGKHLKRIWELEYPEENYVKINL